MTCTLNYYPQVVTSAKYVYMYNHVPGLSTPRPMPMVLLCGVRSYKLQHMYVRTG